jgi:hypothetical protein
MRLFSVSSCLRLAAVAACLAAALVWAVGHRPQAVEATSPAPAAPALVDDDAFAIVKKLIAQDGQAYDFFGGVALSGDTLAVGAKGSTPATSFGNKWSQGAVYVFVRQSGNWTLVKKLVAPDGEAGDQFGAAVALEGDTLVVGAPWHEVDGVIDRGAAYVFSRNAGGANNWGLVKELTVADGLPGDGFGNAVAISGNLIVVGASGDDVAEASSQNVGALTDRGSAYVFERNTGGADNWGLLKQLGLEYGREAQFFGAAVGVSGDVVVVGAPGDGHAGFAERGSAFVFQRNLGGADNFGVLPQLLAPDGLAGDAFGSAVAIQGNLIVVGAPLADGSADQGAAYLFSRNAGGANNYGLVKKFVAADGADSDFFGKAVALDGDLVLIGAPGDNVVGNVDQGSAFLFGRNEGGMGNWGLVQQLFATDGKGGTFEQLWNDQNAFLNQLFVNAGTSLGQNNFGDSFGNGVALSGGTLAVGAMGDDIELDEEQGSAYIFTLSPFAVSPARLADGLAGIPYSQTISPADGVTPFSVVLIAGSLPPGLSLEAATGVISGTPQAAGDFLFTVRVTNSAGQQAVATYGITVNCPDLTFTTAKLPDGRVGKPYRQTLAVTSYPVLNGTLTFTTAERLPIGLTLSPSGQISGTPRISGNYTFMVFATDIYGCRAMRTFTIRVSF